MDTSFLCAAIILGFIGYVHSNCKITPCLYGGTCLPNVIPGRTPFICHCPTSFSGELCERPKINAGLCPNTDMLTMLNVLVDGVVECQADCAFDFECPDEMKCCLEQPCHMRCIVAEGTHQTPCQQEQVLMTRSKNIFVAFAGITNINFRQYVTAIQNKPSFVNIMGSSLGPQSLTQALKLYGSLTLGTIFQNVIAAVPFPDPTCMSNGTYERRQCLVFLSDDSRRVDCKSLDIKFNGVREHATRPNPPILMIGCLKLTVPGDGSKYRDVVTGEIIQCPGIYDDGSCSCTIPIIFSDYNCVPEVDLPFAPLTAGQWDPYQTRERLLRVWIQNDFVLLKRRAGATGGMCAYFDGTDSMRIPRYSGSGWGSHVFIELRYQEDADAIGRGEPEALFTNAACESGIDRLTKPSIVITYNSPRELGVQLYSGVKTMFTVPTNPGEWKTVTLAFDSGLPSIQCTLNGIPVPTPTVPFPGFIQKMTCPAGIGVGNGFAKFKGCIDYVRIYRCIPN